MADLHEEHSPISPDAGPLGASATPTPHATAPPCGPTAYGTGAGTVAFRVTTVLPAPASQAPGPGADPPHVAPVAPRTALERAAALLARHPVADGHNTLARTLRTGPAHDIDTPDPGLDTDIPRLRAGGVGAQFLSLLDPDHRTADPTLGDVLDRIDAARALVARYPDPLRLALTVDDFVDARNRGRIACVLGPVPGAVLTGSLGVLRAFHALGVRCLAPAGATWARTGLTAIGHEMVREANRLGIVLDLAGCEPAAVHAVTAASKSPVVLTGVGAAALTRHPDNVGDELLLALRASRGLVMVGFDAARTGDSLHAVADHLDHVRAVAGPQSVGLAARFGSAPGTPRPQGLADPTGYPRLIAELLDRGWPETEVALLTWGNALRVVRAVDFTARADRCRPR
ncbi:membrane dipeptidase [Streptomyces sp. BI20]|uniref:membrane dipeptidase n=1 Tax=Streptomyces sp. BI20 TaxID=3403460 RepID=UPI003C7509C5